MRNNGSIAGTLRLSGASGFSEVSSGEIRPKESTMRAQKKSTFSSETLELYEKLVSTNPDVERKGATHPYTSLNGNMFSYLHPRGSVALRLPADERGKFLTKYKTTLFEAYGVVQKEYVTVPDALLKKTGELKKYFELSYRYAQTLKPKATKKAPKTKN
jgi:hypothetical protein